MSSIYLRHLGRHASQSMKFVKNNSIIASSSVYQPIYDNVQVSFIIIIYYYNYLLKFYVFIIILLYLINLFKIIIINRKINHI